MFDTLKRSKVDMLLRPVRDKKQSRVSLFLEKDVENIKRKLMDLCPHNYVEIKFHPDKPVIFLGHIGEKKCLDCDKILKRYYTKDEFYNDILDDINEYTGIKNEQD